MDSGFNIQFDYRFDQNGFFDPSKAQGRAARQALEASAQICKVLIRDEFENRPGFSAITVNRPDTGTMVEFTYEPEIDDLVIFVGGRDWVGNTLANGGPVGSWITGSSEDRRYNGDDFQPRSGSISFDTSTAWFFDPTPATLDDVPRQQYDFITVALHEIGHVLGIGSSPIFSRLLQNTTFLGAESRKLTQGQGIPLNSDLAHIQDGATLNNQATDSLDEAQQSAGVANRPNDLDLALLKDIGYQIDINFIQYGASHSDLIRQFGYNPLAFAQHYLNSGRDEGRSGDNFDEISYLAANPDLIPIYQLYPSAAAAHYIQSGWAEGRSLTFDASLYLASNPDLINVLQGNRKAATVHYLENGWREGRSVRAFDGLQYLASHPDLVGVFGVNIQAATEHFVDSGYKEGRVADTFDQFRYIASYPDLITYFGTDGQKATEHYITSGLREGRSPTFDAFAYLNANPDVARGVGGDALQATLHYIRFGFFEGRTIV